MHIETRKCQKFEIYISYFAPEILEKVLSPGNCLHIVSILTQNITLCFVASTIVTPQSHGVVVLLCIEPLNV